MGRSEIEIERLRKEIKAFRSLIDEIREDFERLDGLPTELVAIDVIMDDPVGCIEWAHNINGAFTLKRKLTYEDALRLRYQDVPELQKLVDDEVQSQRDWHKAEAVFEQRREDGPQDDDRSGKL